MNGDEIFYGKAHTNKAVDLVDNISLVSLRFSRTPARIWRFVVKFL